MNKLTNNTGISLPMAVWLGADSYDHSKNPNEISATALLKPIRSIILSSRTIEAGSNDVANLVAQSVGTAIHESIEGVWRAKAQRTLLELGFPEKVVNKIVINPKEPKENQHAVYMEIRNKKHVGKYTISGKFDFVIEGQLTDFKTTKVYGWIKGDNKKKYIQQGSIYRWLNPDIITNDIMCIDFLFTDWTALGAKTQKKYPPSQVLNEQMQLLSIPETEHFIHTQLNTITKHEHSLQEDLPRCTNEELWRKPTVYKYYKNPNNKSRSTKNFNDMGSAMDRLHADGSLGVIDTVHGQVIACRYCNAVSMCTQAEEYLLNGDLKL